MPAALYLGLPLVALLLAMGTVAGFLAGLLGIGGGMLMVPLLTLLLDHQGVEPGLAVQMAIATSMATILFTSLSSLRAHHAQGAVRWPLVATLAPGILLGGFAGGAGVFALLHGRWLAALFAAFIGWAGWRMLRGRQAVAQRALPGPLGQAAVGAGIGLLAGLVGAGGAFLSVPFMTRCRVPLHQAVATSAALGFPIALANVAGYLVGGRHLAPAVPGAFGYLYLPALVLIASASVCMAPVGARLAHRLDVAQLRRLFAVLLLLIAAWMLSRALSA